MTIAVDWDVKNQTKQTKPMKELTYSKIKILNISCHFSRSIILSASRSIILSASRWKSYLKLMKKCEIQLIHFNRAITISWYVFSSIQRHHASFSPISSTSSHNLTALRLKWCWIGVLNTQAIKTVNKNCLLWILAWLWYTYKTWVIFKDNDLIYKKKIQSSLTLQETWYVHDSMNRPKIEFITYIYILYYQSSINFQISHNLAGFPDILN